MNVEPAFMRAILGQGSDFRAQFCSSLCSQPRFASWRMVSLQPLSVATRAFRNLGIGLQTGAEHGRHQERGSCERTKASKNDSKITCLPI